MEPSRFWLRRDDDDRARQVVFDQVQLDRYSDRQRRAILKVMARGKTASHRDISQAVRRARPRPRGEILVAITLAASALAVLIIVLANWHHRPSRAVTAQGAASGHGAVDHAPGASPGALTVIDNADRAWLNDVATGKVVAAHDGSDALSLPRPEPPEATSDEAAAPDRPRRRP